jgi:sortase (surface protein transpeptidase)
VTRRGNRAAAERPRSQWRPHWRALAVVTVAAAIGFCSLLATSAQSSQAEERGPRPVAMQIDTIMIDSLVETGEVVDGALENPSGPWVVRWYRETARHGESGNIVMAGQVDYWDVGPAVFSNVGQLVSGDHIRLTGDDGTSYSYTVDWTTSFPGSNLTAKQLRTTVGPTKKPSLTLITCSGPLDDARGVYEARLIVRAAQDGS